MFEREYDYRGYTLVCGNDPMMETYDIYKDGEYIDTVDGDEYDAESYVDEICEG